MTRPQAAPGPAILRQWQRLSRRPGGKWLFGKLLGRMVPYTATIRPQIQALDPGFARVRMHDRRRVRNHLDSIHAIALMNLAEVTSGLALTAGLPAQARAILTGLSIEFLKKARGSLTAECRTAVPDGSERREHTLETEIHDAAGDLVARAQARWLVGPRE